MEQWQGDAQKTLADLRDPNNKAQDKIRDLRSAVDKGKRVSELVGILDQGLAPVGSLVA